jgi:hypothetical protein
MMEEAVVGLPPFLNSSFSSDCDLKLARDLYRVAAPVIIVLCLCNNILYIIWCNYVEEHRSASSVQKTGIVTANTLLVLSQLPVFIFFFWNDNMRENHVPVSWCNTYRIMGYVLPRMLHTASLWQILFYGIQRLMCLQQPFKALNWYRIDRFIKFTVIIYVCSFFLHFFKLFDFYYETGDSTCILRYTDKFNNKQYKQFYFWFSTIIVNIIPCVLISIVTFITIYAGLRNYVEKKQVLINIPGDLSRFRCPILEECQSTRLLILTMCVEWPRTFTVLYDMVPTESCPFSSLIVIHFASIVSYTIYLPMFFIMNSNLRDTFCLIISDIKAKVCSLSVNLNEMEDL